MTAEPSLQAALSELPPLIEPAAPGCWPPAPGWIMLTILVLGALIFSVSSYLSRRRETKLLRDALSLVQSLQSEQDANKFREHLETVSRILRVLCIRYFVRPDLATRTGQRWLGALDALSLQAEPVLDTTAGETLLAVYDESRISADAYHACLDAVLRWLTAALQRHKQLRRSTIPPAPANENADSANASPAHKLFNSDGQAHV